MAGVKTQTDAAWDRFENSTIFKTWKDDNPGEYESISNYRVSDNYPPDNIKTQFGLGLLSVVKAGKLGDGTFQVVMADRSDTREALDAMEEYLLRNSAAARSKAHFVNSMLALIEEARTHVAALEAERATLREALEAWPGMSATDREIERWIGIKDAALVSGDSRG